MKKQRATHIRLVITTALRKEIPKDRLLSQGISVHTIEALQSGALTRKENEAGILVIITGAGMEASERSACWIRDNLKPLFVLNIGTCGILNREYPIGKWIRPHFAADEEGNKLELDQRLPVPFDEEAADVDTLLSVQKASIGSIPADWQGYDAVDMECYAQAKIFRDFGMYFHCLKFSTDHSDVNALADFNKNVAVLEERIGALFNFTEAGKSGPDVTVIIPVYNRRKEVRRAIDSVLSQSHMPAEILVVDDCSTDGTKDILESYGDKITHIHLHGNSGPSAARNEGVRQAGTEWIAFLDSDDSWAKDKLRNQISYLKQYPFYRILQSEEVWIRDGVRVNPCKHHAKPEGWIWEPSLQRCLVSPSGVLVKKTLLEKYGMFNESLPVCEDYDLWLRISRDNPVGLEPSLSVMKYGGHEDQLSRKYPAMDRFRVKALMGALEREAHREFRKKIIDVLAKKLTILIKGYEKREKREDAEECRRMLNSIRD